MNTTALRSFEPSRFSLPDEPASEPVDLDEAVMIEVTQVKCAYARHDWHSHDVHLQNLEQALEDLKADAFNRGKLAGSVTPYPLRFDLKPRAVWPAGVAR